MDTFWSRWIGAQSFGEDVFGEEFAGREIIHDDMNKKLFLTMLTNYNQWHGTNAQFNP